MRRMKLPLSLSLLECLPFRITMRPTGQRPETAQRPETGHRPVSTKAGSLISAIALLVVLLLATVGTAAANSQVHVVQPGENLFRISLQYGVSMDAIRAANNIYGNTIFVGQSLIIPDANAPAASPPPADTTSGGVTHIVQAGETLFTIGLQYNLTWTQIQAANGLPDSTVYAGQRLIIPTSGAPTTPPADSPPATPPPSGPPAPTSGTTIHEVLGGETLNKIAQQYGVSWVAIKDANHLPTTTIYPGQQLIIPVGGPLPATDPPADTPPAPPPPADGGGGKRFLVVLSQQMLYAYDGDTMVRSTPISSGISRYPTVVGTFYIYVKFASTRMVGPGYDLPNVPFTMYFFKGYGLHGTYWHHNFGHPMSHGCVNMPTDEAEWAFNWATVGTPVIVVP